MLFKIIRLLFKLNNHYVMIKHYGELGYYFFSEVLPLIRAYRRREQKTNFIQMSQIKNI